MQVIEAEYEIVTPMFIGGADPGDNPEIRPPSVKGALRFWWRALQWGQCLADAGNNTEKALQALHRQESLLFGAAVNDDAGGQGEVRLKLKYVPSQTVGLKNPSSGKKYLLGQGLCDGEVVSRQALRKNQKFVVILMLDNKVTHVKSILDALMVFGLLGGLGSRARKGWGAVAIRSLHHVNSNKQLNPSTIPSNEAEYINTLQEILKELPTALPPFSAFSTQMRIDISLRGSNSEDLLNRIGNEMLTYRSFGRNGKIKIDGKQVAVKPNFTGDHNCVWNFANAESESIHPRRVIFGLPHNYYYSDGTKVDVGAVQSNRRASPLIMHIHQFPSGECIAVQSLLKAKFLPQNDKIQLKGNGRLDTWDCNAEWSVITTYLKRFGTAYQIIGGSKI